MRIVAAALAAFLICAAGAAAAPSGERMPALFKYQKAYELPYGCPASAIRVIFYDDIGAADAANWEAIAIFIGQEPRAVLVYLADDAAAEETDYTAYVDLDRDAIIDRQDRVLYADLSPDHTCAIVSEALGVPR